MKQTDNIINHLNSLLYTTEDIDSGIVTSTEADRHNDMIIDAVKLLRDRSPRLQKHTPGPWYVRPDEGDLAIEVEGKRVARVGADSDGYDDLVVDTRSDDDPDEGTEGQDRKSYTDDQDRDSYTVNN